MIRTPAQIAADLRHAASMKPFIAAERERAQQRLAKQRAALIAAQEAGTDIADAADEYECPHCHGTGEGQFDAQTCMYCKGRGY